MPTGEIAPQQASQVTQSVSKEQDVVTPPLAMSPFNQAVPEKTNYFGIEVMEILIWKGWVPGKEFIKNLVLKNVGIKTLKLKFSNPETKFFTTLYPKPVFLSAGASFTLPITFRPLENITYEDREVFTLKSGKKFEIPLRALLPQTDVSIPIDLDFKMCAVKDFTSITFDVYNTGDVDTPLQWQVNEPFFVEPVEAEVKHHSSVKFIATFRPMAAKVYEAMAICKFGKDFEMAGPTTFYGVGKYPHLLVSCLGKKVQIANSDKLNAAVTEINFEKVAVATTATLWVELHNLSPVRSPFQVERIVGMSRMDTTFHCMQTQGIIPPMSLMKIPINFSPHCLDTTSMDYFSVISIGDVSRSIIKCVGTSFGPKVELSSYSINFMQIDMGETTVKSLDLINNSDTEAIYQFELDCCESVFKFQSTTGVLKPNTTQSLFLKFVPQHPINYFRRVVCLIHNQPPIFLDLIGTCQSDYVKPPLLRMEHIERFARHGERGLAIISPELLLEFWKAGRLEEDKNGCLQVIYPSDKISLVPTPSLRDQPAIEEYFNDGFHSDVVYAQPYVSLDVNVVNFGNVKNSNIPEEKSVNITNNTKGKVTVQWSGDSSHDFYVVPSCQDIPPLKTCSFRVTFKANAPNKFYGNELECYVYYMSMRDYRFVDDKVQSPPWCLTLKCLGHTFHPNNETFLPRIVVTPSVVVFPAINTGETAYRTILVENTGETPILYDLTKSLSEQKVVKSRCGNKDQNGNIFSVKPNQGILRSGYQIFTVKMAPTVINTFTHDLLLRLNDNEKYNQTVHLCGSVESPQILLDGEGNMYFKPTCAGTTSSRTYEFKNMSRISLRFQWKISKADKKFLVVHPDNGTVLPNESVAQTWFFTPYEAKKYVIKPILIAWGQGLSVSSSGGVRNYFPLRVIAEGSLGDVQTDQAYVDFGDVVVGSSSTRQINIFNNSNCSLKYHLIIEGLDDDNNDQILSSVKIDRPGVELDSTEGVLLARGKHSITATLRPVRRVAYQYSVSYQLVTPKCDVAHPSIREPQHLVHLLATGVYPSMVVSDIRAFGSTIGISKKSLWNLFSIDDLNAYLNSDPSVEELTLSIVAQNRITRRQSAKAKANINFNFLAAPVGADPSIIIIMFENSGTVPCKWIFMFPKDLQMEMSHWSEPGDTTEEELHEMKVMNNNIFEIEPRTGVLKPGETVTVTLKYHHSTVDTDSLPVLLKIAKGREIMLNFIGVTVARNVPYIHFPSNKHTFKPVPVGDRLSPKQAYELYNGGAIPVQFDIDLTSLEIIQKENFDQPIFECLNPSDEILPGHSVFVEWRFFPLEAKTYMVDIPIKVYKGDSVLVTFIGIGYDNRIMGDTMPFSDEPNLIPVPTVQKAEVPGQIVYLSAERISFGNIPLFAQARRLLFIRNNSKDRSIFFEWYVTSFADAQFLNVYPIRGKIGPNNFKLCKISFLANEVPSFYDLDLVCEISDLLQYTWYKKELLAWEVEKERQVTEFMCTEQDPHADLRTPHVVELVDGPVASRLAKLDAMAEGRPLPKEGELYKYKTLPPIRKLTVDEERERERQQQKKLSRLWQKPIPEKPFLLHLGITVRTHDLQDYQTNFPDEYCHYFIDRTLSEGNTKGNLNIIFQKNQILCSRNESNIIASVLTNCLRGLLDDIYFIHAVKKIRSEAIPYFCQYTSLLPRSTEKFPTPTTPQKDPPNKVEIVDARDTFKADVDANDVEDAVDDEQSTGELEKSGESDKGSALNLNPHGHRHGSVLEELELEVVALKDNQLIKKLPEFGNVMEVILENTILNLMYEAVTNEYSIVSKPRFVAMPRGRMSNVSID